MQEFDRAVTIDGGNLDSLELKLLSKIEKGQDLNGIDKEVAFQLELRKNSKKRGLVKLLEQKLLHSSGSDVRSQLESSIAEWIKEKGDLFILFQMLKIYFQQTRFFGCAPSTKTVMKNIVNPYLVSRCPGSVGISFTGALLCFASKNYLEAETICSKCAEKDSSFVDAYILKAETLIELGNVDMASQTLDLCASANFSVRNQLDFTLVKIKTLYKRHLINEAETVLQASLENSRTVIDRFLVLITFHDLYIVNGDTEKAAKYIKQAEDSLPPSSSLRLMTVLNKAELALLVKDNIQVALNILNTIRFDPRSPDLYITCREKLAEIYRSKLNDVTSYLRIFEDLAKTVPLLETHLRLVDAYILVEEDEKAMKTLSDLKRIFSESIEQVLRREADLYIKKMEFIKAASIVKDAISMFGERSSFKILLAEIMFVSDNFEEFESSELASSVEDQFFTLAISYMSAKNLHRKAKFKDAAISFEKSLSLIQSIMKKPAQNIVVQGKSIDLYLKDVLRNLLCLYRKLGDTAKAIALLGEFEQATRSDEEALNVFDVYLQNGDGEGFLHTANKHISQLTTSVLRSRLLFQQKKFQECAELCKNILDIDSNSQDIMWLLVESAFRISEDFALPEFAEPAIGPCLLQHESCGYYFAQGILKLNENQFDQALRRFLMLKSCEKYSENSCQRLYDILLNRNSVELSDDLMIRNSQSTEKERTKHGESLLQQFMLSDERRKLFELDMKVILSKSRNETEQLCKELELLINDNKRCFAGIFTLASCLIKLGGSNHYLKAKSYLQDLPRMRVAAAELYDYDKCLLVYAQLLIATSKFNFASDLLNDLQNSNPKSSTVYECIGLLKEKTNDMNAAMIAYETSWKLSRGKNSSQSALRLSYMQLNDKRYVEAIDIANSLIKLGHSDAGKIKKEVLDKARQQLRI